MAKASKIHEVIVYEDSGKYLGYLKAQIQSISATKWPTLEETMLSGSERLQVKAEAPKTEPESSSSRDERSCSQPRLMAIAKVIQ
ncbi:unnamed protein product [Euphydryas editha]|uniref:Uncharacterized protein n=1 Tax=Euphydryas editha TaxID=104508 RepID=A0AAU9U2V8_EUPED|nr:unnamed protein product [Euphydryas editha]